jgi:hypothetical protein
LHTACIRAGLKPGAAAPKAWMPGAAPASPGQHSESAMNTKQVLSIAALATTCFAAQAGEVYTGIGFPGLALGYAGAVGSNLTLRGEVAGGLSLTRDGKREGLTYQGKLKAGRAGVFLDWQPFGGSFHLSGGLTANDIKLDLDGTGTNGTINGKPVNLTGETFQVQVQYARSTPFLGLGWGHQPSPAGGLGFFFDLGAQFGRFKTAVQTSIVGKYGVTQADVDAEVQKVRDTVDKLKVLPTLAFGLNYRF